MVRKTSNKGPTNPIYKIVLALLIIIPIFLLGGLVYLYSLQPQYSGRLSLAGLQNEVEVMFDRYGIPHIYGQNEEDVFFALGYVHAQERLFQMELMRRAAAGRLSEFLGEKLVKTDKFFRTLGMSEQADKNAAHFFDNPSAAWQKSALAYLAGVNQFITQGETPLEFQILGIPKEKFAPRDIYLIGSLMAFGFASGFQTDPLVTKAYQKLGWGLTMFENDDVDFHKERLNPDNPDQVWFVDHWEDLIIREETIKVKGAADIIFRVRSSRHGPIINQVDDVVAQTAGEPVAVWWAFNKFPAKVVEAFYELSHARSLKDARNAASKIDGVGLNVMYGDRDGNIAWWAAAKLIKRPEHVHSKLFLDGASGKDELLGYYDFSQNPQSENPPIGFVYSANNQPGPLTGKLYPGYYVPEDRAG